MHLFDWEAKQSTPPTTTVNQGLTKCVKVLMELGANTKNIDIDELDSSEVIELLRGGVDEDEALSLRSHVYFEESLVHRLLFASATSRQANVQHRLLN